MQQGSILSSMLFNIYINEISQSSSRQYSNADDHSLLTANDSWTEMKSAHNKDIIPLHDYLMPWCLKLSTDKTAATAFHLNNWDS